jgi:hypothetical protein
MTKLRFSSGLTRAYQCSHLVAKAVIRQVGWNKGRQDSIMTRPTLPQMILVWYSATGNGTIPDHLIRWSDTQTLADKMDEFR